MTAVSFKLSGEQKGLSRGLALLVEEKSLET